MKKLARIEIYHPHHTELVFETFERLFTGGEDDTERLKEALREVIENVLLHAYEDPERFWMEANFSADESCYRIDISESGMPFDFGRYRSESIERNADHTKGFYRIYDLVERFYFSNIPGKGKRFSLITPRSVPQTELLPPYRNDSLDVALLQEIHVRRFEPSDSEGIARLIYRNYDHTYYKTLYYDPAAIENANASGHILSIVALYGTMIVGHFALILSASSNIAEIGAAVVDPRFKGNGIMNRMFDYMVAIAGDMNLSALYGEAIMIHPYSQKANLRHGMVESAILLGEVPSSIEIEHRLKDSMRSGALEAFLLFDKKARMLYIPQRYHEMISATYAKAEIPLHIPQMGIALAEKVPEYRFNPVLNIGTIHIDAPTVTEQFDASLNALLLTHCDMIYADINLCRIEAIDELIALLNNRRFFYGGIMFSFYKNEDYLRLQRKNAPDIDEEQLVCYSEFAKELLAFILADERRVQ